MYSVAYRYPLETEHIELHYANSSKALDTYHQQISRGFRNVIFKGPGGTIVKNTGPSLGTRMYHGTSVENARAIMSTHRFHPSSSGQLGPGIYFADLEKATHFARDASKRGKGGGAAIVEILLKTSMTINFLDGPDPSGDWRMGGFDVAYTPHTSESRHGEWCVCSPEHIMLCSMKILSGG